MTVAGRPQGLAGVFMSCEPSDVVEARDDLALGGQQFDVLPILDVRLGGSVLQANRSRSALRLLAYGSKAALNRW